MPQAPGQLHPTEEVQHGRKHRDHHVSVGFHRRSRGGDGDLWCAVVETVTRAGVETVTTVI